VNGLFSSPEQSASNINMESESPRDSITRASPLNGDEFGEDIEKAQTVSASQAVNELDLVQSHISHQDMHAVTNDYVEPNADQYKRFSKARKAAIVAVLSFCSFLAPISSTSILAAIPEVAKTFNTTGSVINASNALYLAFMGIAATFWGPLSQVWGRRPVSTSPMLFY
jgi:Major Facilitator Superfamily.